MGSLGWRLIGTAGALAAGAIATKVVGTGWKAISGREVPSDPSSVDETGWGEALLYAAILGLAVGAETGEVGEGGVRAEDVVAVVAADLEPAGGDDEALALVGGGDGGAALGGPLGRLGEPRALVRPRGPVLGDEGPELVGRRSLAVVCLLLLLAHRPIVSPRP